MSQLLSRRVVEELRRLHINWAEVAKVYRRAKQQGAVESFHPKRVVRAVGYARFVSNANVSLLIDSFGEKGPWVSNMTRINLLSEEVLDMLDPALPLDERLTTTDALVISHMKLDQEGQMKMAQNLVSVRRRRHELASARASKKRALA